MKLLGATNADFDVIGRLTGFLYPSDIEEK
jgi:hypothetical protein